MHQKLDLPQQQPVTKYAPIPHKVRPKRAKPIPSEQPNIIEDDDGNIPKDFQHYVYMSPSGPHIILPDAPVTPPRVRPAETPRVDTVRTSSKIRSSCAKNTVPKCALTAQLLHFREANTVIHQISGVDKEYRHLVKGQTEKIGNDTLQMNWGN